MAKPPQNSLPGYNYISGFLVNGQVSFDLHVSKGAEVDADIA